MISDVHGRFDKLMSALDAVNFNKDTDTLVSLGDAFDRGDQNLEVLKFLMDLPHKILIWGNHDLRLRDVLLRKSEVCTYDYSNGMLETIKDLCGFKTISSIADGVWMLENFTQCEDNYRLLLKYFSQCIYAAEFEDLICTHCWVPLRITVAPNSTLGKIEYIYSALPDWRAASKLEWEDVSWEHTENICRLNLFPDKKLIVGHWHAWRLRTMYGSAESRNLKDMDFTTFCYEDKLVAIDGCSNFEYGVVNAYVYESAVEPKKFDLKQK